ncbi:MAG: alpha-E domain-containing protein [Erysipelotrichaceae bacterium]
MGIITLEKANHLFWLGRYTQRLLGTIREFMKVYDLLLDVDEKAYEQFCVCLSIPYDIYADSEDFINSFVYDASNPDSLVVCINHAYDNAIELRDDITSETLAYIEMAKSLLEKKEHGTMMLELQKAADYINAFWGMVYDSVAEASKNIIKCGKHAEKLDIIYRFHNESKQSEKELAKLQNRISSLHEKYSIRGIENVVKLFGKDSYSNQEVIDMITALTNCFENWLDE